MKSETGNETFTQTRSTWLTLTGAGLLWVAACLWAFSAVDFKVSADMSGSAQEAARLALEAEEQIRLEAQGKAAERRQIATARESEQAALKAKALAEQNASRAAEAEELARQQAQAKAAEADRLAEESRLALEAEAAEEEAKLAEQAKVAEEMKLAEQARVAEEMKLAEQARAAEEAESAAQARVAEQQRADEAAEARQLAAVENQRTGVDEKARQAAAAEASRIAALARQQRSYASARDQELRVLAGLSARLRFAPGSATVSRQIERTLDDIFNPLYLYSDAYIRVSVATNEYDGTTKDGLLSRDRGRAIASYLIDRGLENERFRIHIETGEQLPTGTHRIRVSAEEVRK